jgi:hypothetical protein
MAALPTQGKQTEALLAISNKAADWRRCHTPCWTKRRNRHRPSRAQTLHLRPLRRRTQVPPRNPPTHLRPQRTAMIPPRSKSLLHPTGITARAFTPSHVQRTCAQKTSILPQSRPTPASLVLPGSKIRSKPRPSLANRVAVRQTAPAKPPKRSDLPRHRRNPLRESHQLKTQRHLEPA